MRKTTDIKIIYEVFCVSCSFHDSVSAKNKKQAAKEFSSSSFKFNRGQWRCKDCAAKFSFKRKYGISQGDRVEGRNSRRLFLVESIDYVDEILYLSWAFRGMVEREGVHVTNFREDYEW